VAAPLDVCGEKPMTVDSPWSRIGHKRWWASA
jgi:hypothetical protein